MNKKSSTYIIGILVIAIIFMSTGFALTSYTQLLEINANNVTVKSASWNVHFDQSSYVESTGSVSGTYSLNNSVLTYNVTLSPDEFYSAEVDVKNDGTFDAQLESIVMTPTLSTDEQKYLNYYIEYDNQTYNASQVFGNGPIIAAGQTKHVKVFINYFMNATNAENLPATDNELSLSVSLNYKQV